MKQVFSIWSLQKTKWKRAFFVLFHSTYYTHITFEVRERILPAFFPRHCPVCKKLLPLGQLICVPCEASLPWIRDPVCFHCGKPVSSPEQELCYDCRQFPKSFHHGTSLLLYNEKTQPIMADFKYHNRRTLSRYFAEKTVSQYISQFKRWNPQLIVPVPIHKHKRKNRGYNQAALLARDLSVLLGIPCIENLLIRVNDTTPQKQLTPQARLTNLEHAFSFNTAYRDLISGIQTVLLVDDIYTTGATMEICTRVLKKAGMKKICICSICSGMSID